MSAETPAPAKAATTTVPQTGIPQESFSRPSAGDHRHAAPKELRLVMVVEP